MKICKINDMFIYLGFNINLFTNNELIKESVNIIKK